MEKYITLKIPANVSTAAILKFANDSNLRIKWTSPGIKVVYANELTLMPIQGTRATYRQGDI